MRRFVNNRIIGAKRDKPINKQSKRGGDEGERYVYNRISGYGKLKFNPTLMEKEKIMKKLRVFVMIVTVLCLILTGCTVFHVSRLTPEGKRERLGGIPFYTKAVSCLQETRWLEAIYKLKLVGTTVSGKPVEVFSLIKEISLQDANQSPDFMELIKAVSEDKPDKAMTAFYFLPQHEVPKDGSLLKTDKLVLASNQNKTSPPFVDYTDPHYYNVRIPLVGTATTEINLNSDLTLSKVSATIQEQTLKTVSDMLISAASKAPVDIFSKEAKVPGAVMGALMEKAKLKVEVHLTIEPQVYQYIITSVGEKARKLPCGNPGEPLVDIRKGDFSCSLVPAEDKPKDKDSEKNTIKISGSINLPKAPTPEQPKSAK